MKPATLLTINIGKGHICVTSTQLVVWLHRCSSVGATINAMRQARELGTLPEMFLHLKNTHAARVQFANAINICSARYEGRTGRCIGTLASAHNWNVTINA